MLDKLKTWLVRHHIPTRLIVAVIAGIVISKVLMVVTHESLHKAGIFPPLKEPMFDRHELLIAFSFHSFYAVVAAYFTAWIAKNMARRAAFILGSKEAVMWLIGSILLWNHSPLWFNIAKAAVGIPLAILGGRIFIWNRQRISLAK
jgi:hypothetical protein